MSRSRVVAWLRIALPLAALALLSTLFLIGDRDSGRSGLPFADISAADLPASAGISAPSFAGVAEDGTRITMTAASASPATGDTPAMVDKVALALQRPDGAVVNVTAGQGQMQGELVRLTGKVAVMTSTGWVLRADDLMADTTQGTLATDQPLVAEAPFGRIEAQAMDLRRQPGDAGAHVLDLKGGVRMVYEP